MCEVLVHHTTQVRPKHSSRKLTLSAIAVLSHNERNKLNYSLRLQDNFRKKFKEHVDTRTRCCGPELGLVTWGGREKWLLKCVFLFFQYSPSMTMSVWSVNKSRHEDHSELALFRELLQKKIIRPSVQFNKRISDTIRPTFFFFFLPSPLFCQESGSQTWLR